MKPRNTERQIRDELVRRVVGLDRARQTFSFDVREEDLIDALTEITDLSREEIAAIARDIRAQYTAPPLGTPRFWMLELLALVHADALYQVGRQADAVAVLQHAIKAYHGGWERDLKQRLARYAQ